MGNGLLIPHIHQEVLGGKDTILAAALGFVECLVGTRDKFTNRCPVLRKARNACAACDEATLTAVETVFRH